VEDISDAPRAWDFIFNALPYERHGVNGLFLIVTLKDGGKIGGVFSDASFAALWPYDRDLFLGPAWEMTGGVPLRQVLGSVGLYVSAAEIQTMRFSIML
jgi:hypothetical protein